MSISRKSAVVAAIVALAAASSAGAAGPEVQFLPDGSAHIVDITVPVPSSLSPEAQASVRDAAKVRGDSSEGLTMPVAQLRAATGAQQASRTKQLLQMYPVEVKHETIAGVPVALVTPMKQRAGSADRLLINFHGGAFFLGQGSIQEAIPIAALSGIPVLAVDYRLAPEHPYPAAVDDAIAVYREMLKTYSARHVALYGSSAGAILSAETSVRARALGLPLPAAIGFFSGTVDFAKHGDSEALFGVEGFTSLVTPVAVQAQGYLHNANLTDPVLSPAYADVRGFPPTLLMCSTRDLFLSGTTNFDRQLLRAGVDARLVVFDGLPHVFWGNPTLPESHEALALQASFLAAHVMGD